MIVEKGKIPQGWMERPAPPSTIYYDCYKCNRSHRFKSKVGIAHRQYEGVDCTMALKIQGRIQIGVDVV